MAAVVTAVKVDRTVHDLHALESGSWYALIRSLVIVEDAVNANQFRNDIPAERFSEITCLLWQRPEVEGLR